MSSIRSSFSTVRHPSTGAGIAHDPVRRDRSDGIDLLRAVFALWVVLTHLMPWTIAAQGAGAAPVWLAGLMSSSTALFQGHGELHPAVLGFIVLSGYCIHRAGLRAPASRVVALYAVKRAFRILPVYYLGILVGLLGFAIASHRSALGAAALSGTRDIDPGCIMIKALAIGAVLPRSFECAFLGNAPLATVMVELVLYAAYAAAFPLLVWRGREKIIWRVCIGVFAASVAMFSMPVAPSLYAWWQNGSLFGFLPYWWLGVLFVDPAFAEAVKRRIWAVAAAWLALSLALWAFASPAAQGIAEMRKLAFALAVGVLIYVIDNIRMPWASALTPVGRAGYGLYVVHAPLTYTLALYGCPWWANLAANVLAGLVIHRLIERPLIDVGRAVHSRLAARPAPV